MAGETEVCMDYYGPVTTVCGMPKDTVRDKKRTRGKSLQIEPTRGGWQGGW